MKVSKNSPKTVQDEFGNTFKLSKKKIPVYNPYRNFLSHWETYWSYDSITEFVTYRRFSIKITKWYKSVWSFSVGYMTLHGNKRLFKELKNVSSLEEAKSIIDKMQSYFRRIFPKGSTKSLNETTLGKYLLEQGDVVFDDSNLKQEVWGHLINVHNTPRETIEIVIPALRNLVEDETLIDTMCAYWRENLSQFMK